jgi:hypothetical protein
MSDILIQLLTRILSVVSSKLIPMVGVGGSVEAMKEVPWNLVTNGLIVLGLLGVVFGIVLAIIASRFVVKVDPKVEQVRETLPGANCGACGFAGCMGYAEAVAGNPDVAVSCAARRCGSGEDSHHCKKAEKVN